MSNATTFFLLTDDQAHAQSGHPERPERLEAIRCHVQNADVWDDLQHLHADAADLEAARDVHEDAYLNRLRKMTQRDRAQLDADTYVTAGSLDVACRALGGLLALTDAVASGHADNGFAALRPPGHHARPDRAMGFCLLNHVAIAARYAQRRYDLDRILIVDFDVHHGNGTQEIFYEDPDVLYMSTHQHPFYPGTGSVQETGAGDGKGKTVNVPLQAGVGDTGYRRVFRDVLRPIAHCFEPQLVLLSAGFDAHHADELAQMNLSLEGYADLVQEVQQWANDFAGGRLVGTLEGGYQVDVLAHGVTNLVRRLRNPEAKITDPFGSAWARTPSLDTVLSEIAEVHDV